MTALAPAPAARNPQDMDRVNLSPPTTAADVASVKHGTLHVTRYLRQRWRPEWQRAGLSPTSVQGTFSHLMALRKLQDLERRGEVPEHAGQIKWCVPLLNRRPGDYGFSFRQRALAVHQREAALQGRRCLGHGCPTGGSVRISSAAATGRLLRVAGPVRFDGALRYW